MTEPYQQSNDGAMGDLRDTIFNEIDGGGQEKAEEKDETSQGDE